MENDLTFQEIVITTSQKSRFNNPKLFDDENVNTITAFVFYSFKRWILYGSVEYRTYQPQNDGHYQVIIWAD